MQERDNLSMALRDNIFWKTAEGGAAGAARVHNSGNSRIYATLVRMDPQPGKAFKYMSMEIDQAGGNNRPRHFNHAPRLCRGDLRCDARDFALLDRYVMNAVQAG